MGVHALLQEQEVWIHAMYEAVWTQLKLVQVRKHIRRKHYPSHKTSQG